MKGLLFCFSNHHGNPPKFILSIKPLASDIEGFCFYGLLAQSGQSSYIKHLNDMTARKITFVKNKECWECNSHTTDNNGYPIIKKEGKSTTIFRYIYKKYISDVPKGMVIRHTCDNRMCINPSHLILGTHADNVADRVLRGRSAAGIYHGRSKLIPEQVLFIRNNLDIRASKLAKEYSVDPKVISDIRNGKTWRTLQ